MFPEKTKIVIIDDEKASISILESFLKNIQGAQIIGKFSDPVLGLEFLKREDPDILFLDLEMPRLNGVEILRLINTFQIHIHVIIITAYQNMILEAAKFSTLSYLLKPIDYNELIEALRIYISHMNMHTQTNNKLDSFLNYLSSKIKIPTSFEELFFAPGEIYYLEADGNYTKIHLIDGTVILSSFNLGKIHKLLPESQFYRISRASIINYTYIKKIDKRKKVCVLNHLEKETEISYTRAIIARSGLLE